MRDADTGTPYGILGASRDISARKAIEARGFRVLAESDELPL